jgi:hypothetical protein
VPWDELVEIICTDTTKNALSQLGLSQLELQPVCLKSWDDLYPTIIIRAI